MRAVHLVLLTEKGQPGYPTALTDPDWGFQARMFNGQQLVSRPFSTNVIDRRFVKIVAAEGHGISAVEAALRLSHKLHDMGIRDPASEIAKIKIRTMEAAMKIIDKTGELRNAADRDHCMRYMVSLALLKRSWPEAKDYEDSSPWATSPEIETLRACIEMVEDEQLTRDYHDKKKSTGSSGLTITLKDGREMQEVLVEYPIGHPWREDTEKALREKTVQNLQLGFDERKVGQILEMVEGEGFLDKPVSEFVDLLWKGQAGGACEVPTAFQRCTIL
jgi:2-methylcitrate dehydratase